MIQKAIEKCNGNLSAVAAQLGITRQTLYNKMKKIRIMTYYLISFFTMFQDDKTNNNNLFLNRN